MDSDVLIGDIDAWFDAFERGDFAVMWELQQQAAQKQLASVMYPIPNDVVAIPACDASLD